MPSSNNINIRGKQSISNAMIPPEGPVALKAVLDFTGGAFSAIVDLTQQTTPPVQLSFVQGLYVDNSLSNVILDIVNGGTGQKISIQANAQAYIPVLASLPPIFTFNGRNNASPNAQVTVFFLNVPMPAIEAGPASISGFTFSGNNLLVQDTAAEASLAALQALISAGGLNVNVIAGGGGGGGNVYSGVVSGGNPSDTVVFTPASGKKFLLGGFQLYASFDVFRSVAGGANLQWTLYDFDSPGQPKICGGYFYVPQTAAATPPTVPTCIQLYGQSGMNVEGGAANGRLIIDLSSGLSGGALLWSAQVTSV